MDEQSLQQPVAPESQAAPVEQPVAPQEPVEPAPQEVLQEAPVAGPEPVEPTQTNEQVEAPVEPSAPVSEQDSSEEVELDTFPTYQQNTELPQFDWTQLPQDTDGNIDPNAFAAAINQQITQATEQARQAARAEAQEQIKEQKLWEQAENAYPELKQDRELREFVRKARWGDWVSSNGQKNPTPKQIADKLFNKIGQAKKQGVEQAQNNVRIQESAVLETASNTAGATPQADLRTRVATANTREQKESATNELLRTLIDSGDISIAE